MDRYEFPHLSINKVMLRDKDSFGYISPEEYEKLGINPNDILIGTFAARKHPSILPGRFGGNAYGFGITEVASRLNQKELVLVQKISNQAIKKDTPLHYAELNNIYKKLGLLIRMTNKGEPYYLIPLHLISGSFEHVNAKVEKIESFIQKHHSKYKKEYYSIAVIAPINDLVSYEISLNFREHNFIFINSVKQFDKLRNNPQVDMVIFTEDPIAIIMGDNFFQIPEENITKNKIKGLLIHLIWNVWKILKTDGDMLVIANHNTQATNRSIKVKFLSDYEKKSFVLFSHIFRTKKRYHILDDIVLVNMFDFQQYLNGFFLDTETNKTLFSDKKLDGMTLDEVRKLPYLNYPTIYNSFTNNQINTWKQIFSIFFSKEELLPFISDSVSNEWNNRFEFPDSYPNFMLSYSGKKLPIKVTYADILADIMETNIAGCSVELLSFYRDSFEYVLKTLDVLSGIYNCSYGGEIQTYMDRLKIFFNTPPSKFKPISDIWHLTRKKVKLKQIQSFLSRGIQDGKQISILKNLEVLPFFGFAESDLKEIVLIVLGHSYMGRIISGKMNEDSLKPLTDHAITLGHEQSLNLLRYLLLTTTAETEASRPSGITKEELRELFMLFESAIRAVTNESLNWSRLQQEEITALGGISHKIIRKLLQLTGYFESLYNWNDLKNKGRMEKESLADYDRFKLRRINSVIRLVDTVERFETYHLSNDPMQVPLFYGKFLSTEFHGTGHLFRDMDIENVFTLIWIAVNINNGAIINFNPMFSVVEGGNIKSRSLKINNDVKEIKVNKFDTQNFSHISSEVYTNGFLFIPGTGLSLKTDSNKNILNFAFIDIENNIQQLEDFFERNKSYSLSKISSDDLLKLERLFTNIENFHNSHIRFFDHLFPSSVTKPSAKQTNWFLRSDEIIKKIENNIRNKLFSPESVYSDMELLNIHAPSVLNFVIPEFTEVLHELDITAHKAIKENITQYFLSSFKKLQALVTHNHAYFHDVDHLHSLAHKEFGPMATGIIGLNENQLKVLESIAETLLKQSALFDALLKSILFQNLGLIPRFHTKYQKIITSMVFEHAKVYSGNKKNIAPKYQFSKEGKHYFSILVENHSLLMHILSGEKSPLALDSILKHRDINLCEAFFLSSIIMLSAVEDFAIEELAEEAFFYRNICIKPRVVSGKTSINALLKKYHVRTGSSFLKLNETKSSESSLYHTKFINDLKRPDSSAKNKITLYEKIGKRISAIERFFRLNAIYHIRFQDVVNFTIEKIPSKYIYCKHNFTNISYSTFEEELHNACRIYEKFHELPENTNNFLLDHLSNDNIQIFGYGEVRKFLHKTNNVKLLLTAFTVGKKNLHETAELSISFIPLINKIEKHHDILNNIFNSISYEDIREDSSEFNLLFDIKTGIVVHNNFSSNLIEIDFEDPFSINSKIATISAIDNIENLRSYHEHILSELKRHPFQSEDYRQVFEQAFEARCHALSSQWLLKVDMSMANASGFQSLEILFNEMEKELITHSFLREKARLHHLYELNKNILKRKKLAEIESILSDISDITGLNEYWSIIKEFFKINSKYIGKDFEYIISRKFDLHAGRIKQRSVKDVIKTKRGKYAGRKSSGLA